MKSQWKYNRIKKIPPKLNIRGFCCSIASMATELFPLKTFMISAIEIFGTTSQIITKGKTSLTNNTDVTIPKYRNLFLHFSLIVLKTCALIIALSTLLTTSNKIKPSIIIRVSTMGNLNQLLFFIYYPYKLYGVTFD